MRVNVQYAETHLADLISAADNGELVEIARPDKPALRLLVDNALIPAELHQNRARLWGAWEGKMVCQLTRSGTQWTKKIEEDMLNGPRSRKA